MSFKDILKVFKLERELTDDETALLNTLRGMSESERELLSETLNSFTKSKGKPTTATKRVIEKCAGCDYTKRHQIHKDNRLVGYHEFKSAQPAKSGRRRGMPASSSQPPRCVVCHEIRDHANHDLDNGGHEFTTDLAGRVNAQLAKHEYCIAMVDDNGGEMECGKQADDNIHHLQKHPDYHEFVASETAVGVGG